MKLEQSFDVEAPLSAVWEALTDVQRVAPCLPGAEVSDAGDDGVYQGTFTKGKEITNTRTGKRHKVGRIVRMHSDEMEEIEASSSGFVP